MTATSQSATWRSLLAIVVAAVATFIAVDYLVRFAVRPVHLREVEEGVADYRSGDPQILVLGSSHARTFEAVGNTLAAQTGGAERLVAIPVEFGKLDSYRWVLEHRLLPLMTETGADGRPIRKNLSRFILVTEWWDSCANPPSLNLPSRAWVLRDFVADFLEHGLTDFNRNYLQTRWRRHLRLSALVQDRGHNSVSEYLRSLVKPKGAAEYDERVREWREKLEDGSSCIGNPDQMAALREILDILRSLRVEVTLLLFPRKPDTITARAKQITLMPFANLVRPVAATYNARFVDFTTNSPLRDADFMADFDHVTAGGNRTFAGWALDGDLRYLLTPAPTR
jgi:hypothetical protein